MSDWRDLTDEEREALEPGDVGWRYERGTVLEKGQWVEELREPEIYPNGGEVRKIRWGSNGVGLPAMTLIGTPARETPDHKPGYHPLPFKAYRGFTPASPEKNAAPKGGKARATKPEPTP